MSRICLIKPSAPFARLKQAILFLFLVHSAGFAMTVCWVAPTNCVYWSPFLRGGQKNPFCSVASFAETWCCEADQCVCGQFCGEQKLSTETWTKCLKWLGDVTFTCTKNWHCKLQWLWRKRFEECSKTILCEKRIAIYAAHIRFGLSSLFDEIMQNWNVRRQILPYKEKRLSGHSRLKNFGSKVNNVRS